MAKRKAKAEAKPRGRPSLFTQSLAERICARLAAGETLRAVCREDGMPSAPTVISWTQDKSKEAFSEQYARARETGYALMADHLTEIADNETGDPSRDRLRVDTRKWLLSKALPKVYGERIAADIKSETKGEEGNPQTALQLAREIAFALSVAMRSTEATTSIPDTPTH